MAKKVGFILGYMAETLSEAEVYLKAIRAEMWDESLFAVGFIPSAISLYCWDALLTRF